MSHFGNSRNISNFFNTIATATPTFNSHKYEGKTLHQQKDYDSLKAQMTVSIF
jgi:hypothetical protein